jgi:hypothetical protein
MNIVIKLISVVSLVLAPWFVRVHGVQTSEGVVEAVQQVAAWLPFVN